MKSVCRTETGRDVVPDKELVERSLSGEEDAFRQLYERYRVAVYTAVYRIVRDREEALDLTQEVFIAAFRSLGDWNAERAGFFSWIYKMAVNRAIDGWRKQRRRAEVSLPENWQPISDGPLFPGGTPGSIERIVQYREMAAELQRILKSMPFRHRRFIVLRYCDGLKLREIAEKENCRLGTVKSVLHRSTEVIRFKLRQLSDQLSTNSPGIPAQDLA
jgi:RNA polymerase sigma-70 factor (ECF subfamily)